MKTTLRGLLRGAICILFVGLTHPALAERESVIDSPHNLAPKSASPNVQGRVCIFCHAPHHSSSESPLWSRELSTQGYTMYQSDTMLAPPGDRPQGSSRLCLSCHDGTIAIGLLAGSYALDSNLSSFNAMPPSSDPRRNPNLGTDLSDDHPISFEYTWKAELAPLPEAEAHGARLVQGGFVECTSCHDPHDNRNGNFLVVNVDHQQDALCTICHRRTDWGDSYPDTVHRSGGERYPAKAPEVAAAGCMNCHRVHSAPGQVLLKKATITDTCTTTCHRDPPYRNILDEFERLYRHPLGGEGRHSAGESLPVATDNKHVECVDCHNPHRAGWQGAPMGTVSSVIGAVTPPEISGALRGVRVESLEGGGRTATAEYEICFKCHAGSYAESFADTESLLTPLPIRQYENFDEAVRFAGLSAHPVTAPRLQRGIDTGRSLKDEFKAGMERIYCIDCHVPHGSDYPHLLARRNVDRFPADTVGDLETAYPLCFACHSSFYLTSQSDSRLMHSSHLLTHSVPCATCHDPHGVPGPGGASMINFDLRYAGDDPTRMPPVPTYDSITRSCTVACHSTGNPDPKTHSY